MMHDLALQFKVNGHDVWMLTPAPRQKEKLRVVNLEGINVLFFNSGKIKNISKVKRAINESLLPVDAWKASRKILKHTRFDGVVYYSPSIFWGKLVRKLCAMWKCKSYLILRDKFPQWAVDNGLISKYSPVYWYFRYHEWMNYYSANRIGVMSPSNLEYFRNNNKDISKFEVLYNWATISPVPEKSVTYRNKLNLLNKIVFFYGGNIGHAQKMINLVNLAKHFIYSPEVHFLFVGNGDEVEMLLKEKEKYNLYNITYLCAVDQISYFEMLNEFDVGLFSLHPKHKTHNFPGKLLGYMAYEKPILGCVNRGNDLKDIVNQANAGIVVDCEDKEAIVNAAKMLIESDEKRILMGKNGRKLLSEKFSVENACNQIEKALNS